MLLACLKNRVKQIRETVPNPACLRNSPPWLKYYNRQRPPFPVCHYYLANPLNYSIRCPNSDYLGQQYTKVWVGESKSFTTWSERAERLTFKPFCLRDQGPLPIAAAPSDAVAARSQALRSRGASTFPTRPRYTLRNHRQPAI